MDVEIIRRPVDTGSVEIEVCHFPFYEQSAFLQKLKSSGLKASLDSPAFTKEIVELIKWYLTPQASLDQSLTFTLITDSGSCPQTSFSTKPPSSSSPSSSFSSSSSSSPSSPSAPSAPSLPLYPSPSSTSSSSFLFSPPSQYLKEEEEIEKRALPKNHQGRGEFLQNAIIAADHFELPCLVHFFAKRIRDALSSCESADLLRSQLGFKNDLDQQTKEQEESVWARNCVGTRNKGPKIKREATENEISQSFYRDSNLLPAVSAQAHPDSSATKCSFKNCGYVFGITGKHHCRNCGQIFCATHASKWARLPENDRVEPEVGPVSRWYTYLTNYSDPSLSRICDDCFEVIQEEEKCQSSFQAFGLAGLEIPLLNRALVVSHSWRQAAQKCLGILINVQYKLPGDRMSLLEKRSLWNNREYFVGHPRWLVQVVRMADLSKESVSKEVYRLVSVEKAKISCNSAMCQIHLSQEEGQKIRRQVFFSSSSFFGSYSHLSHFLFLILILLILFLLGPTP